MGIARGGGIIFGEENGILYAMKPINTRISHFFTKPKRASFYALVVAAVLIGVGSSSVAYYSKQIITASDNAKSIIGWEGMNLQTSDLENIGVIVQDIVEIPAPAAVDPTPANATAPPLKTTTGKNIPKMNGYTPPKYLTKPLGSITTGQTYCESSNSWASIVEASFNHFRGQTADASYQLEATLSGQTKVLYTGTVAVPGDGAFSIRPPVGSTTRAVNVRTGDTLRVHIMAPFDVYSQPYNVVTSMSPCGY